MVRMTALAGWMFLALCLFLPSVAQAQNQCKTVEDYEVPAYRGFLSEADIVCLEDMIPLGSSKLRVKVSFMLIVHHATVREDEKAKELMVRHLTKFHTTDPEVSYLYSTYLFKEPQPKDHERIITWAAVALDGKHYWLHDPQLYTQMVQSLYGILVDASLEGAVAAEVAYKESPSESRRLYWEKTKRRARYYLTISGPCLALGDCAPEYIVTIEGDVTCNDLEVLMTPAGVGILNKDMLACLKGRYQRRGAPKRMILDLLALNASAADRDGTKWNDVLAWHWDQTGAEDPVLAYLYAKYLTELGPSYADPIVEWSQLALREADGIPVVRYPDAVYELHTMSYVHARLKRDEALAAFEESPGVEALEIDFEEWQVRLTEYEKAFEVYCDTPEVNCLERPWEDTDRKRKPPR